MTCHSLHPCLFSISPSNYLFSSSDTSCNFNSITSFGSGEMGMDRQRLLAYLTGTVDQELLLRVAENCILKASIETHLQLSDAGRATLAEIGHRLSRKALPEWWRPKQIRFWVRIGNCSPTSSVDRKHIDPTDSLRRTRRPRLWWCGRRRRILAGATTAWLVLWPILDTTCQTRRWVISSVVTTSLLPPSETVLRAGETSSVLSGCSGRD